ncbi:MAG: hypothetical protein WEA58_00720 [Balneolaceae bacterium]
MLETLYNYFGFVGALLVSLSVFFFFIFWIAGVAGICDHAEKDTPNKYLLFFAIVIPIYPVAWIIIDMIQQKRELRRL